MFSATLAENRKGSSLTTATALRSERRSTSRTSAPSSSTLPALVSYRREISETRLVLPEPVAPTSATVVPAGTSRSTSQSTRARARAARADAVAVAVERELARAGVDGAEVVGFVVAQRHAAKLHVAVAGGQLRRAPGGCDDARLAVEHLEDARARGGRALGQAERDAERAHRADEHVQVQVELRELAEREVRVDHAAPADQQHGGEAELRQEADRRVELRLQARGDHRLVEHARDAVAEALELVGLAREGLDDAHAGDVLLGVGGELGDALLDLLDRRARACARSAGR